MSKCSSFQKETTIKQSNAPSCGAWIESEDMVFMTKNSGGSK